MADVADMAAAESDFYLEVAIQNAKQAARTANHSAGFCRWCGDRTPEGASYCPDNGCREDHERFTRFNR
jgi:hypothetical protein